MEVNGTSPVADVGTESSSPENLQKSEGQRTVKGKVKRGKNLTKVGKGPDGKVRSRSARAGVQFPVCRVHRYLKKHVSKNMRVGGLSGVFAASVMEYLAAEVLELAGNAAKEHRTKRITPRHIMFAVRSDEELDCLIKATVAGGGVMPHIDDSLLSKSAQQKRLKQAHEGFLSFEDE
uniref:Histone H2A n=1 Tax=Noctiluca scintillans TaxID=2966 RepID=A0A7S0ZT55_NOCSC